MKNIIAFAARMAACNDCKAPTPEVVADVLHEFSPTKLQDLDTWLLAQSDDDLETLADGDEDDIVALEASAPDITHNVLSELFDALCA